LIQRVVYQLQRQLAATGSVEESGMLADRHSGSLREVDVVVRARVADHDVLVGIECRDHRRKATVEWVEQMAMKHSALPTSKLVLVSRSGFSEQAIAKARQLGVDAYAFDEAAPKDWTAVLGENAQGPLVVWSLRIRDCWLVLKGDEGKSHPADPKTTVFSADGSPEGSLGEVVHTSVQSSPEFTQATLDFADGVKDPLFVANVGRRPPIHVATGPGELLEVAFLRLLLEAVPLPNDFRFESARYRGNPVAFGESVSPAGHLTISLFQPSHGAPIGSASVVDSATGDVSTTDVQFPSGLGTLKFMTGTVRLPRRGPA
jgi:hypothetical protein